MAQKCKICHLEFQIINTAMTILNDQHRYTNGSFCPFCGAAQENEEGFCTGVLRIGSHIWRVHIHPEFSKHDIEFRDGAGNTLVIMRNVG